MIDSKFFEVPDFAMMTRQEGDPCNLCVNTFNSCIPNLGFNNLPLTCECVDICAERVILISDPKNINECINFPQFTGTCRFPIGFTGSHTLPAAGAIGEVVILSADEVLNNCSSVDVTIQVLIIFGAINPTINSAINPVCCVPVTPICVPATIKRNISVFHSIPDCGTVVTGIALQEALRQVDGSCIVIQLNATVETGGRIRLSGQIIDKLFKFDDVLVQGIVPFAQLPGFTNFTVKTLFGCSPCDNTCPSLATPDP